MKEGHRYTCSVTANDEATAAVLSILAKILPPATMGFRWGEPTPHYMPVIKIITGMEKLSPTPHLYQGNGEAIP